MPLNEKSANGIRVYISVYLVDSIMVGKPKAIDEALEVLQNYECVECSKRSMIICPVK